MFVIGNFISALANLINFILGAYMWVIVGRAIISWVNPDPYNPIVRFLYDITNHCFPESGAFSLFHLLQESIFRQ